jgi:hypothetical protein
MSSSFSLLNGNTSSGSSVVAFRSSSDTRERRTNLNGVRILFLLVAALYFLDAITKSATTLVQPSSVAADCIPVVHLEPTYPFTTTPVRKTEANNSSTTTTKIKSSSNTSSALTNSFSFFNSTVRFIFFIGLEGTGHHLLKGIVSQSPAVDRLRQLHIHYNWTVPLQESLHHEKYKNGLFNVHCQQQQQKQQQQQNKQNSIQNMNTTKIQDRVVDILRQINLRASLLEGQSNTILPRRTDDRGFTHPSRIISLPVNTLQASSSSGEMSYPNYHGECRKLNFPKIDLWYQACSKAQVDCYHVYLYRDPYAIFKSTTVHRQHNNNNNNNKLATIHLYTTLQTVIMAQLMQWSDRTLGCLGMLDHHYNYNNSDDDENKDKEDIQHDWWETIRIIFGWKNQTSFHHHVMKKFYKPRHHHHHPVKTNTTDMMELVPLSLVQPYMDSWLQIHQQTIQLCQQQAQQNHHKLLLQ